MEGTYARIFRLKHPKNELYLGGFGEAPYFVEFASSYVFEDIASVERPGYVRIVVPELERLWLVLKKEKYLIFHQNHGDHNQLFKVHFLARDVVAIESFIGGCLKYDDDQEKLVLEECNYLTNFKNQTFLITDTNGLWLGSGSTKDGWGLEIEDGIVWGECPTCVPGGFGSLDQGVEFDVGVQNGIYTCVDANAANKLTSKFQHRFLGSGTSPETVGMMNPFSYRYKTTDELGRGMPQEYNGPYPSTYIINMRTRRSSRDGTADETTGSELDYKKRHNLDFPRRLIPELADDESYYDFLKTGKLKSRFTQDSFGNELKSEDHKLDTVFDNLSTEAKKDALNLAGIYVGDRNVYSSKAWPHTAPVPVGDITMGFGHRWE